MEPRYKSAYLLLGHGSEERVDSNDPKTCIVPPNCMVVVDAHAGEVTAKSSAEFEYFIYAPDKTIFLNPEKNYVELVKNISSHGSLAIYKEGDVCPNFSYSLISFWMKNDDKNIKLHSSGVFEYPFVATYRSEEFPCNASPKELLPFILDNYRIDIVKDYIDDATKDGLTLCDVVENLADEPDALLVDDEDFKKYGHVSFNLTQEQLFQDVRNGHINSGVFYNLICRATTKNVLEVAKNTEEALIKNSLKRLNLTRNAKTQKTKFFIPEILSRISEAERQRKPYMPEYMKHLYREQLKKQIREIQTDLNTLNSQKRGWVRTIKRLVPFLSQHDKEEVRKINENIEKHKVSLRNIEKKLENLNKNNNRNTTRRNKRRKVGVNTSSTPA